MKKFHISTIAIISACLLSACANDDFDVTDNASTQQEQAYIGFSIAEEELADSTAMQTKATRATEIITSNNITDTDFMVYAFKQNGEAYMGNNDSDWGNNGTQIIYGDNAWGYKNATEKKVWPSDALDFYAVSPSKSHAAELSQTYKNKKDYYQWNFNASTKQISYTAMNEYGESTESNKSNIDVMYAVKNNMTSSSNNGKVQFKFKHILSQVEFQAKCSSHFASLTYKRLVVEIEHVFLHNVKMEGVFTLPTSEYDSPSLYNWDTSNVELTKKFTIKHEKDDKKPDEYQSQTLYGDQTIKIEGGTMLMIPQTFTKWDRNTYKKPADALKNGQSYLEIKCKIRRYHLLPGWGDWNSIETKTIYLPFGATIEPGKKYTFTIDFSSNKNDSFGYDKDGNVEEIEWIVEQ